MSNGRIVLTTYGSLGDLHPFIAVALALKARGAQPVLAIPPDQVAKVRNAGLDAEPCGPAFSDAISAGGKTQTDAMREFMRGSGHFMKTMVIPFLDRSTDDLMRIAQGARAIVAAPLVPAANIVSERLGLPLIPAFVEPFLYPSAWDPPSGVYFDFMMPGPTWIGQRTWNRFVLSIVRLELMRRFGLAINRERARNKLQAKWRSVLFERVKDDQALLLLFSPLMRGFDPSAGPNIVATGLALYDKESGLPEPLDPELDAFMADGEPPLVFTLGSLVVLAAGQFYHKSVEAARRIGRRALIITGPASIEGITLGKDVMARRYVPFSQVFPRAAAIVHQGGIGTCGQALLAGRPQLIVPHLADQWDNARRIERLGAGRMLSGWRYTVGGAAKRLDQMLKDPSFLAKAEAARDIVRKEDGGAVAADIILRTLNMTGPIRASAGAQGEVSINRTAGQGA